VRLTGAASYDSQGHRPSAFPQVHRGDGEDRGDPDDDEQDLQQFNRGHTDSVSETTQAPHR